MIFPHLQYKDLSGEDFEDIKAWCDAINASEAYCKKIENIFEFEGICRAIYLPAFHPYWRYQVQNKRRQSLKELERKVALCKEDPSLIKFYFGKTACIFSLEQEIERLTIELYPQTV